ncbi:MAG: glycosyltransferase [candidate division WOR-3 bacterium]|nr:MAG: glycosyltransferase [candidate division WOR-3 bacterium]
MKILIIVNTLQYGGAERQAVVDANALADAGYQVTVGYNEKGALLNLLSKSVKRHMIESKNVIVASVLLFRHLLYNRYDIIHSHMFWAERVSAMPGKLTGHTVIFNEHGLGLWRKWYHIITMKIISRFADRIIASCHANRTVRLQREKLDSKKVVTIYNSCNTTRSTADSPDFFQKGRIFTIGFVGRFSPVKRLGMFIDVAERLKHIIPDFRIVLVGDGEERRSIEEEIAKKNLTKYFHFPGFILNIEQYYKSFDVFLLPSRIEGLSIALLEAGAFGIPAIAFNVGGNSEIIQDGITGYLIPDNDIHRLVEKIVYLYENHDKRDLLGLAAQDYITKTFSESRRLSALQNIYNNLC